MTNLNMSAPLMTVVDYLGYRVTALASLPIQGPTLIYGSSDGCTTINNVSPEFSTLWGELARTFNLKEHRVEPWHSDGARIAGPFDIEGHLGSDGRFYVVDYARLMPPEYPTGKMYVTFT
mgnify:CR=1 FL=1